MIKYVDIADHARRGPFFQELVFHIGPALHESVPADPALHARWHDRRSGEARVLLDEAPDGRRPLAAVLETTFSSPVLRLFAGLSHGGIRGISCPNLRLCCLDTHLAGRTLLGAIKQRPEAIEELCRAVASEVRAQWIVAWYYGMFGKKQVQYDADPAVQ